MAAHWTDGLSSRARSALRLWGLDTPEKVRSLGVSGLLDLPNVGRKTVMELSDRVGLEFDAPRRERLEARISEARASLRRAEALVERRRARLAMLEGS